MPNVAENGPLAEPQRAWLKAWVWLYAPDGRMARGDFFYAIFARSLGIGFALAFLRELSLDLAMPTWTIAIILTAGGPLARRLHDVSQSGLHAPWLCFSVVLGCVLNDQLPRPIAADTAIFFFLSWVPYLLVLALILWPGTKGPNHYGPPPA
ncbi:DUF805 domain-containing protein [Dongia sedimenti]|uniref:DUF805 domain-containing protein n=1 Tax=Dongia sedimenti TaxID=3064282 RepID=A0ABU0YNA8_9PROT|nr:DUF805 domain-containing protein [Rhodospirillaceae bacterium R-7]